MTAPTTATEINPEKVEELALKAFTCLGGAVVAGMIYLGDKLGLYSALSAGPATSEEFAARTGLNERWVREWLRGQVAAGFIENDGEVFSLSPEGHLVLVDESTPASAIGAFDHFPEQVAVLGELDDAFRTGIGFSYDHGGAAGASAIERMLGPWNRSALVSEGLPAVPGLVAKLTAGAKVGDIGCGSGAGDIAIAKAFPNCEVHGYDNSKFALERANGHVAEEGLTNITFHNADTEPIPQDGSFDAFLVLDALHDMNRPDLAMKAVRGALKPDGVWFIVDVNAADDWHDNLEHPLAAMMYGFSIMTCMSSSSCTPDGLALGTVGLPDSRLFGMLREAGFTRMGRVPGLEHPFNAYYYAQP
ncbi:MAG: class I SAM-dependent methyltransferase [Tepidiformaceae bacterium]